jgi:hypothetical protein
LKVHSKNLAQKKPHALAGGLSDFKLHQALGRIMMVGLQTVLVTHHLAVEFVDQFIHGGVQVSMRAFGKQLNALDVDIAFCFLPTLLFLHIFQGQQYLDIDHLVKMALDPVQLAGQITAQGGGNFQMVTTDRQVHKILLNLLGEKAASQAGKREKIRETMVLTMPRLGAICN